MFMKRGKESPTRCSTTPVCLDTIPEKSILPSDLPEKDSNPRTSTDLGKVERKTLQQRSEATISKIPDSKASSRIYRTFLAEVTRQTDHKNRGSMEVTDGSSNNKLVESKGPRRRSETMYEEYVEGKTEEYQQAFKEGWEAAVTHMDGNEAAAA
jgi:hypothetical protein